MAYILLWISLVIISISLIFINRWVKEKVQKYALVGLIIVEISLIVALVYFK